MKDAKASFFRQSGWLMIANIAGGFLNWGVHFLQKALPESVRASEYGAFGVFLSVAMVLPTMSFQMVMAHQTALALATNRKAELTRLIRRVIAGSIVICALLCIAVLLFQQPILEHWKIKSSLGLWITLIVVLFSFWMPLFWGVLQGEQNFFSLGWSMMSNGAGRLVLGLACVLGLVAYSSAKGSGLPLGTYAAGMMIGVAAGMGLATSIAAWKTRALWLGSPSAPFGWRALAREAVPPMLGFAAFQFLFTADQMFVKAYFTGPVAGVYFSAGTLSRALMWLVGPLASVMFPRIVQSRAKAEKTNLVTLVLVGTAVLAGVGALGLGLFGPLVVRMVYGEEFVSQAKVFLPWYAGAMVPLAVANVLLSNLLAKSSFKVAIPVCLLAVAYGFALRHFHATPVMVLQVLGAANLLLLLICGWFSWQGRETPNSTSETRPV
jgi:O-antigen/teichoic acid export membrane protein